VATDPVQGPLREQLREILAAQPPVIRDDLLRLLGRPSYALHPDGPCRAGMMALEIHAAIRGEPAGRAALLAAAAVELQMEAAYVFDEVADAPPYPERGEDLALAIALLTLGTAAAVEAATGSRAPAHSLRPFCASYGQACAGQYLDARLQRRGQATLEEALETTCLKSGGLGRFVGGFAARVAGAEEDAALFESFGGNLFTLGQLVDDMRDAWAGGQASDLWQRKATLPVVFYGRSVDSPVPPDGMISSDIQQTYESSGAPLYAAILAQAYLSRAREDLSLLTRRAYAVGGLGRFLESVESDAEGILGAARLRLVA